MSRWRQNRAGAAVRSTTLFALARFLTQNYDGPVVDRTGLKEVAFDFDIDKMIDFMRLTGKKERTRWQLRITCGLLSSTSWA